MKKFFLTVCCLMVASVAMAQSDTVANVKNVYVTQDADRGRILLTVGGYQVGLTSRHGLNTLQPELSLCPKRKWSDLHGRIRNILSMGVSCPRIL